MLRKSKIGMQQTIFNSWVFVLKKDCFRPNVYPLFDWKEKKIGGCERCLKCWMGNSNHYYSYIVDSGESTKQLSHYYTFSINWRKWFWQEIDMIAALPRRVSLKQTHNASIFIRSGLSIKFKSIKFTGEKISLMNTKW